MTAITGRNNFFMKGNCAAATLIWAQKQKNKQVSGPDHVGGVDVRNMPLWPIHRTAGRRSPWPRLLLPLPMCQVASGRGRKSGVSSGMNGCVSAREESIVLIWLVQSREDWTRVKWPPPPDKLKAGVSYAAGRRKKKLEKLFVEEADKWGGREGCTSPRSHYHHSTKGQYIQWLFCGTKLISRR